MNRRRILSALALAAGVIPCLIVSFRVQMLDTFAIKVGAEVRPPSHTSELQCTAEYCVKNYRFSPPPSSDKKETWIGFHSTFLSGTVLSKKFDTNTTLKDLLSKSPNWHRFLKFPVTDKGDITIAAVAPIGRKKIGMDWQRAYFADQDSLSAIQTVHALFNIHIYLVLALLALVLTVALRASYVLKTSETPYVHTFISGSLIATACFLYSHVFDLIWAQLGLPKGFIDNAAKWVWGPSIFFLVFSNTKLAGMLSAIYVGAIALTGGMIWDAPLSFHLAYPVIVILIALIVAGTAFTRAAEGKWFQLIPAGLVVYDALVINGYVPLITSTYLSPLFLTGWFAWVHLGGLQTLVNLAVFGHKQEYLIRQLNEIRPRSQGSDGNEHRHVLALANKLAIAAEADRVSIFLLNRGEPLIARYIDGHSDLICDGFVPPVFARVLQTKEEMFMVAEDQLAAIRQRAAGVIPSSKYGSRHAIITPIIENDRILGAIALANIYDEAQLLQDKHHQDHVRGLISLVVGEIANVTVRDNQEHLRVLSEMQENISSEFIQKTHLLDSSERVFTAFGECLYQHTKLSTVFFSFSPVDSAANYITSYGISQTAANLWQQSSFFARKDNRLSPIAIAVNEERAVYIQDIRSFYGFLQEKSINALNASEAAGFTVLPIKRFGKISGVMFAIQPRSSPSPREMEDFKFLENCVELLALQLYQSEINAKSARQEGALKQIIDPGLIETVLKHREKGDQVVGVVEHNFMFLVDMRGSTIASRKFPEPTDLARRLARIYDRADRFVRDYGGYFEKGSGDGLFFTLKDEAGAPTKAASLLVLLESALAQVAASELGIQRTIMIAHYGKLFRGVMGSTSRMAWDNCGTDLINCFDIEKSAKRVDGIVLAISSSFASQLGSDFQSRVTDLASNSINLANGLDIIFLFNETSAADLRSAIAKLVNIGEPGGNVAKDAA